MASVEDFDFEGSVGRLPSGAIDALATMIRNIPPQGLAQVDYGSGESAAVFFADAKPDGSDRDTSGASRALKIFHGDDTRAAFEARIVEQLSGGPPPPLLVPRLISYTPEDPGHLLLSKVPGHVLPNEAVRSFTDAEKQKLGQKIGEFVAWLSQVITPAKWQEIVDTTNRGAVPDRINNIVFHGGRARSGEIADDTLSDVLIEVIDEYEAQRDTLTAPIVGHNDLRADNITFTRQDGQWRPNGVFDFGITRPSSAERELRHLMPLGEVAIEPAIAAYEQATGQALSRPLLRFWAIGQAASACASFASGSPINIPRLTERVNDLTYLLPDRDWSGLQALLRP